MFTKNWRLCGAFGVFTANKIQCLGELFVSFHRLRRLNFVENNSPFNTG